MKRITVIVMLLLSISIFSYAQNQLQDVVYLKNGSIIRGTVVNMVPNETLRIQTLDGSTFVYQMNEVEKITKEQPVNQTRNSFRPFGGNVASFKPGYEGSADLGYTVGTGTWSLNRFEFNTSHGYRFNPYFYLGAGLGFHYYHEADGTLMPLFVDARADLMSGNIVPFVDLRAGYSISLSSDEISDGGAYLSPSVGVRFFAQKKVNMNVSIGYSCQWLKVYYGYGYNVLYTESKNFGGVSFKVGVP